MIPAQLLRRRGGCNKNQKADMAGTWGGSSDSFVHGRILRAALMLRVFAEWLLYGAVERAGRKRKCARRHLYGEAQREVFDQPRCPSAAQLLRDLRRVPRKITALAHLARCCFVQVGVLQESSRSVRSPFCCANWFVRRPTNKTFPFCDTRGDPCQRISTNKHVQRLFSFKDPIPSF